MRTPPSICIQPLKQAPEHANKLAHWLHLERMRFGAAGTEAEGLAKLGAECANSAMLPHTLIALAKDELVGAVTLMQFHGPLAAPSGPWLTNLWVHPTWRSRGIGASLCQHLCDFARAQNFPLLQLFTYDKSSYYRSMGWHELRTADIAGRSCTIMGITL